MLQVVSYPRISKELPSDSQVDILPETRVIAAVSPVEAELRTSELSDLIHHPIPKWKRLFDIIAASLLLILSCLSVLALLKK